MNTVTTYSENEDDPAAFESSGDEWHADEPEKKRNPRRSSRRLSKKPRVSHATTTAASDSSEEDDQEPKKRQKNGMNKKRRPNTTDSKPVGKSAPRIVYSPEFAVGSFVILKSDAQVGDPTNHPCLWRIDGKNLLQKYVAFNSDGEVRHKNTSIYTGWSVLDQDLYAPVAVTVHQHSNQNCVVSLHWDKLKQIIDSD